LGHIHQPQMLLGERHVRYCGSIERLDLGERDDEKGVVLLDVGPEGLRGAPAWLPLDATPIYDVTIDDPDAQLPGLPAHYPRADRPRVRYRLTCTPGQHNLEALLRTLDGIFPRWYDRSWTARGALGAATATGATTEPAPPRGFHDTVIDYLKDELAQQPEA